MFTTQTIVVGAGLFFLFIFLCGIWLTRSGKPYNGIVLAVHKLISLAAAVLLVVTLVRGNRVAALSTAEWIAGLVTGLFFLGAIVSGGLLSTEKPMPAALLTVHKVASWAILISTTVTLYLLVGRS